MVSSPQLVHSPLDSSPLPCGGYFHCSTKVAWTRYNQSYTSLAYKMLYQQRYCLLLGTQSVEMGEQFIWSELQQLLSLSQRKIKLPFYFFWPWRCPLPLPKCYLLRETYINLLVERIFPQFQTLCLQHILTSIISFSISPPSPPPCCRDSKARKHICSLHETQGLGHSGSPVNVSSITVQW